MSNAPLNRKTALVLASTLVAAMSAPAWGAAAPAKAKKPASKPAGKVTPAKSAATEDDESDVAVDAADAEKPEELPLVTLGTIDGESDHASTAITIRLDRKPSWDAPSPLTDHGTFLQLTLPGTIAPEPGKFFDGSGPYIKKIAVLQQTPSDTAVRFFVDKDAALTRAAADVALLDKRVVLTLDHTKLEPTAASIVANTEVTTDIPPPAQEMLKEGTNAQPTLATGGIDLREKLIKAAAFSGIMILLMGGSFALRPYLRRRAALRNGEDAPPINMRTLASMPLAPRQKIQLIQVGDEKFLIGVTPDSVSFLTAIGVGAAAPRLATAAAALTASPQMKGFSRILDDDAATLDLQRKPTLKDIPGNDESTLRGEPAVVAPTRPKRPSPDGRPMKSATTGVQATAPVPVAKRPQHSGRINIAVGDDGVKQLGASPSPRDSGSRDGRDNSSRDSGTRGTTGRSPSNGARSVASDEGNGQQAIDDVTRLIREKLKTLRTL